MNHIIDASIETLPWEKHVGKDIGGVSPTSYGWNDLAEARELYIAGPAYADWLAACHRAILPNDGNLSLVFDVMTDSAAPQVAQALEFDTRLSVLGLNYNFSSQFNYQTGAWQISDDKGNWVNTGWKPGKFQPDIWYGVQFDYSFNLAAKKFAYLGARAGVKQFLVPSALQNISPIPLNWADSCSLQMQLDLSSTGGAFSIFVRNVRYLWS
jgi:hypothetical protein